MSIDKLTPLTLIVDKFYRTCPKEECVQVHCWIDGKDKSRVYTYKQVGQTDFNQFSASDAVVRRLMDLGVKYMQWVSSEDIGGAYLFKVEAAIPTVTAPTV